MGKNKSIYFLFAFVIVLFFFILISKNTFVENTENTALVLNGLSYDKLVLEKVYTYTSQANEISSYLDNPVNSVSMPQYQKQLNDALTNRKELIRLALARGVKPNDIPELDSSVAENSSGLNLVESKIIIDSGNIATIHVDDFTNYKPSYEYLIISDTKTYNLVSNTDLGYVTGRVSLSGVAFGSDLYLAKDSLKTSIENTGSTTLSEEGGRNNTLVILLNFLDSTEVPFSRSEAESLVFNGQFDKFMREQSFNKAIFTGDVFGWLTLNKNSAGSCSFSDMQFEIDAFAVQNNIDIRNYDHLVYLVNCLDKGSVTASSTIGKTGIPLGGILGNVSRASIYFSRQNILAPAQYVTIPLPFSWTNLDYSLSHELGGHGLGVWHANGWDCGESQITSPCNHIEYGSSFDVMGNGDADALHFNAHYKNLLGWFNSNEVLNISKSGNYSLAPVEGGGTASKLAYIKLPGKDEPSYSIEYRKPFGFDIQLNQPGIYGNRSGLYVNKMNSSTMYGKTSNEPELIDANPTSSEWFIDVKDSVLQDLGDIFNDPKSGLTIKPKAVSANGNFLFEVIIKPTQCVTMPPEIALTPNEIVTFKAGAKISISGKITNEDYNICPSSDFNTEILQNDILNLTNTSNIVVYGVTPNTQFFNNLSAYVKPDVVPGQYQIEVKSTNLTTGLSTTKTRDITIIQ